MQVLYEVDASGHGLEASLRWVCQRARLDKKGNAFVREVAHHVIAHSKMLDDEIQRSAPNWPLAQLPVVDRNILRIAIYEIKVSKDVSLQIAINEAVELAKHFGGEGSPRFVNGALGAVASATS